MDQNAIKNELDTYLVKDYLTDPKTSQKLNDPFPKWFNSES